jgi:L-ascorbate metabolism protein UlaG (beta-lactamase superfamily)
MIPALAIKWLGQACFLITTMGGSNVVVDPFGDGLGYKPPAVKADIVFVSHDHFDHNAVGVPTGNPKVVRPLSGTKSVRQAFPIGQPTRTSGSGDRGADIIHCTSIPSWHDSSGGKDRGANTIRVFEVDGLRVCHLGDLGHVLTAEQVKAIGTVDVLMIPVGGVYTIDAAQAQRVVRQLEPRVVIPMHYQTPALKRVKLGSVDGFLKGFKHVKRMDELRISKESLPKETTVVVLKY